MTVITNTEAYSVVTMQQVQTWCTNNSISITTPMSLTPDIMGVVKEFDIGVTLTALQIADFKQQFFNMRIQGSKGDSIASASTITCGEGNLFDVTGTTTINHITTTDWKKGSTVSFHFLAGPITVNHNAGSTPVNTAPIFLDNSSNFNFKAQSMLSVIFDGDEWREIARTESSP